MLFEKTVEYAKSLFVGPFACGVFLYVHAGQFFKEKWVAK